MFYLNPLPLNTAQGQTSQIFAALNLPLRNVSYKIYIFLKYLSKWLRLLRKYILSIYELFMLELDVLKPDVLNLVSLNLDIFKILQMII